MGDFSLISAFLMLTPILDLMALGSIPPSVHSFLSRRKELQYVEDVWIRLPGRDSTKSRTFPQGVHGQHCTQRSRLWLRLHPKIPHGLRYIERKRANSPPFSSP